MFYAWRERSERISTRRRISPQTYSSRLSQAGNAPVLQDPIKSPALPEAGTHFWKTTRSLHGSRQRLLKSL